MTNRKGVVKKPNVETEAAKLAVEAEEEKVETEAVAETETNSKKYYVVVGKSLCGTKRGLRNAGDEVTLLDVGDKKIFDSLVKRKLIAKK